MIMAPVSSRIRRNAVIASAALHSGKRLGAQLESTSCIGVLVLDSPTP